MANVSGSMTPVRASTTSPFLNAKIDGMLRMPYLAGVRRFVSSISNFTKFTSGICVETCSKMGPNMRHGPHHDAQKSTRVSPPDTISAKFASFACCNAIFFSFLVDICAECIIIVIKSKRNHKVNKIIYLDAAATALKPDAVIMAEADFLRNKYANAGRGICARAAAVDDMVATARARVARFVGAAARQIVFTSGATGGLNQAARMILNARGGGKTRVAVSDLDHHSARLPWVAAAGRGNAEITVLPLDAAYNIDAQNVPAADVMVLTAMSNVFGAAQDVCRIVRAARMKNPDVVVVVDASQYASHIPIDADAWDADFICFSGHKIGADTGIGVMYVKNPDVWMPDNFGGGMVNTVNGDDIVLNSAPERFEAGTLPLTQIVGLPAAIDAWTPNAGLDVMRRMHDALSQNKKIKIHTVRGASVLTFTVPGMHPLDFGARAGARGLCMRVGNMCASWAMNLIGAGPGGAVRLSAGAWNTAADADAAVGIITDIVK